MRWPWQKREPVDPWGGIPPGTGFFNYGGVRYVPEPREQEGEGVVVQINGTWQLNETYKRYYILDYDGELVNGSYHRLTPIGEVGEVLAQEGLDDERP